MIVLDGYFFSSQVLKLNRWFLYHWDGDFTTESNPVSHLGRYSVAHFSWGLVCGSGRLVLFPVCHLDAFLREKLLKSLKRRHASYTLNLNRGRPGTTQRRRESYLQEVANLLKSSGQYFNWNTAEEVNRPQVSALRAACHSWHCMHWVWRPHL